MTRAIGSGEKVYYLLYSPVWETAHGPFELESLPASHAVAVTQNRFLLSTDAHVESLPPSLVEVPLQNLWSVDIGSALLLGWLSLRFLEKNSLSTRTIFFRATGVRHFEAAVRVYRSLTAPRGRGARSKSSRTWAEVRAGVPHSFSKIEPLLLDGELPWSWVSSPPLWRRKRGSRGPFLCAAPACFFLLTSHGVFAMVEESGPRPGVMSYGVKLSLFRTDVVRSAEVEDAYAGNGPSALPRLTLGLGETSSALDFPVDRNRIRDMRAFAYAVSQSASLGRHDALRRP